MTYTKQFTELSKNDSHIAGGKGASLGEMMNAGIPVPDGYVVTADTFDHFIHETDLIQEIEALLDTVDTQSIHTVERASEKIQELIMSAEIPEDIEKEIKESFKTLHADYVAVRSSATAEDGADHAWAGQLSSFLNTTEENLLEKVQACWASLFTPRAIFYRFEKKLHTTHISVAVVVQKMVNSEKSGIAFSVHPVTEDYNQMIIEAGFGLGEAIVSGSVTPDSYVITKEPRTILDINVSTQNRALYRSQVCHKEHGYNEWRELSEEEANKQVLSKEEILELSDIIVHIEQHYGFPVDTEWAFENGKFYITQSRPITTLRGKEKTHNIKEKETPKKLKPIEKTISRDLPLANIYAWHKGYTDGMKAFLGWSYSDSLFYVHDGFADIMRPPEEHTHDFKNVVIKKIEKDSGWFKKINHLFAKQIDDIFSFYDSFDSKIEKGTKDQLLDFYTKYIDKITDIIGPFITMYWLPIWAENDKNIAEKYKKEVSLAKQARIDSEQVFPKGDALLMRLMKKIVTETKLDISLVKLFSKEDVINYLKKNKIPKENILKRRLNGFIYSKKGITLMEENDGNIKQIFANLGYLYNISDYSSINSITGTSAYKGKISGRVRVIMQKNHISDFKDGEVLITSMTTPEFVPALKKAAAFVTDEGGVTCHAAIVSRELDIPCIIGTKFATQVLKNGDLVEVDADNGVVIILERAGEKEENK